AVGRISADRIASIAQQVAREENALASKVDLAAAIATLQDSTLERINPTVVGAYLERIGRAQILAIRPAAAGDGLFLADAASGTRRVRWEVLANLEGGEHGGVSLHPAVSSSADDAAAVVVLLEEQRRSRILADWVARAEIELEKLPERLVGDIAEPTARKEAR